MGRYALAGIEYRPIVALKQSFTERASDGTHSVTHAIFDPMVAGVRFPNGKGRPQPVHHCI